MLAALAEVGHLRAIIGAVFALPVDLGSGDDRHTPSSMLIAFKPLETKPTSFSRDWAPTCADELQVVNEDGTFTPQRLTAKRF
jgi:hypothetical protein